MSKSKNYSVNYWLSANKDGKEKSYIQVGLSLLTSDAFKDLTEGARLLYFDMALEARGNRSFSFPQSVATAKYGFSPSSLRRWIKELEDNKFIKITKNGRNTRTKNQYEFSFEWKGVFPNKVLHTDTEF